ncbi:MAG: methyltransferase domain-containing protein [bacterium]|nr:methyltransferase domain-containing protein [bacterium]
MRCARGLVLSLTLAAVAFAAAPGDHATSDRVFDDVPYWESVFDDPKRDAWQKPADLVAALAVLPGTAVADLGAGTGYFVRYLSRAVGPHGTVYAVEVEPKLVAHLRERAEREETANVVPVLTSKTAVRLPAAGVDLLLVVDTYHHIDARVVYMRRAAGVLRPGGRVAIVDWHKRPLPEGPAMDHKLAEEQVVAEMERAGYRLLSAPDVLPYQYVLIFARR